VSESLIAALKVAVAEEQVLEGQRTAQKGEALQMRCTHIEARAAEPLVTDRPHELLIPLPLASSKAVDRPAGSVEAFERIL
jgi:hypothetical protein